MGRLPSRQFRPLVGDRSTYISSPLKGQRMSDVAGESFLTRRIVQLLVTEVLSYGLFFSVHSHGDPLGIRIGLGAPIALIFLPLYAMMTGEYLTAGVSLFADVTFGLIISLSIKHRWKWVGGTC